MKPKLLVLASGSAHGGGSGFENLVKKLREGEIVAVVSNYERGGVRRRAERLGVPFEYFPGPWTAEAYQAIVKKYQADFVALSGWLKLVKGLDPRKTFNIHPGPLPRFGGKGLHGIAVHEAVLSAFRKGEATHSAVTMHFVTDEYDQGPIFFVYPVPIMQDDTPESLGARVNTAEHEWQPRITDMVLTGQITWDGKNPASLTSAVIRA